MFIFENDGQAHVCQNGSDMMKAMGHVGTSRTVIMTDEDGRIVGAGTGAENLIKSQPMIKAMRASDEFLGRKPGLASSEPRKYSRVSRTQRELRKGFSELIDDLNRLKRARA